MEVINSHLKAGVPLLPEAYAIHSLEVNQDLLCLASRELGMSPKFGISLTFTQTEWQRPSSGR